MPSPGSDSGELFSVTATSGTSAVATKSGIAGKTHYITDITGSSDKTGAKLLVKSGTTVIWQDVISTIPYEHNFQSVLRAVAGADVSVTVDGTALCNSNIAGYTV